MAFPSLFRVAAVFGVATHALVFPAPEPTQANVIHPEDGWTPRPTLPPSLHDLRRRQSNSVATVLVAQDNVCGYISGIASRKYACASSDLCVFSTSSSGTPGAVGCCSDDDCEFLSDCVGQADISASCDGLCLSDTATLKCTIGSARFCNTVSFFGGITDYYCQTTANKTPQKASTTFSGESGGRSLSTLLVPLGSGSASLLPSSKSSRASGTQASQTSQTGSSKTGSGNTASQTSGEDDQPSSSGSSGSSTPIGPIVGGVVGGIVVIALVALGIFFCLRKKKAQQPAPPPPMQNQEQPFNGGYAPPMQNQEQPFNSGGYASPMQNQQPPFVGGYDPTKAELAGTGPTYSTPPQGQGYPTPPPGQGYSAPPPQQFGNQGYYPPQQNPAFVAGGGQFIPPDRQDTASPPSPYFNNYDSNNMSNIPPPSSVSPNTAYSNPNFDSPQYPPQQLYPPSYQQQQAVPESLQPGQGTRSGPVHEAEGSTVGAAPAHHRGQMHELT
ncbi:hypothetical protein B0H63DRAFT_150810 [Podospora didyma]|uniref:Mid2 domain-containing protein n=1 Tax=Podospora didyma TaxID=330526 RepID=A0AAE0NSY4_9PEZI|nr:hypothetical protein B0H63DRAFT_150810 [Podospora didyma]